MKHIIVTGKSYALEAGAGQIEPASRRTLHEMLVPFPVAYFTAAFVTDLVYWRNPDILWERFSVWLIAGGLVMAALVAVVAVIDLTFRRQRPTWLYALGYALAALLSLLNVCIHSRDGYTAVVPEGLMLSATVVIIMVFTSSSRWALTHRTRIGADK
jgi:uncharacterized membrane protein